MCRSLHVFMFSFILVINLYKCVFLYIERNLLFHTALVKNKIKIKINKNANVTRIMVTMTNSCCNIPPKTAVLVDFPYFRIYHKLKLFHVLEDGLFWAMDRKTQTVFYLALPFACFINKWNLTAHCRV